MQKLIDDLKAAMEAEAKKNPTDHMVIARELIRQLEARLIQHVARKTAPAPVAEKK